MRCFPWKHSPPGEPSGGVVYLRIVLSPEQASRMLVFLNRIFYRECLLAPRPTPKLEDHHSSAVRDCLFNLFAATLLIGDRSFIRNLRTRHAVVKGIHYMGQHETTHKNTYNQVNPWRGSLNPLKRPLYTDSYRYKLWIINYNASHRVAVVYICVCVLLLLLCPFRS